MKLTESYNKVLIDEFWDRLEEELLVEAGDTLASLLSQADEVIFNKFGIKPNEKKYCIVGSARLYIHPALRDAFGLTGEIGDLDLVIPNKQDWIKAGLEENWNKGGIYRPTEDGSIEAFNIWDPRKAGGAYAKMEAPRKTTDIINSSTFIDGYYFMSLKDIIAYKSTMNREKEQEVVNLMMAYEKSGSKNRKGFLRKMIRVIGLRATKQFLGNV